MQEKPSALRVLFDKHREVIMYLIFGAATTAVSWLVYGLCVVAFRENAVAYNLTLTAMRDSVETEVFNVDLALFIVLAKVVSWIISVLFAFVTNKIWVFESKSWRPGLAIKEASAFIGGRALTGILEIIAVPLLVAFGLNQTLFGIEGAFANIIVTVVIVILNYILSKFGAFKAAGKSEEE